jgi:hypothetical protein
MLLITLLCSTTAAAPSPRRAATPPRLPATIRRFVASRHQTIPSSAHGCNVFSGHFFRPSQTDWAVLCASDTASSLLIFVAGRADSVQLLAMDAQHPCRVDSLCACGFTLCDRPSVQSFIEHVLHDSDPGTEPPPVTRATHDGVEEWYDESYSIIHYYDQGHWVTITGMD